VADNSVELPDEPSKIDAINILVHKLPEPNFELLTSLSRFLIHIVRNAEVNKMTVRNGKSNLFPPTDATTHNTTVGIVFAPTLNIPNSLIQVFLENFETIFSSKARGSANYPSSPIAQQLASRPPATTPHTSEDIRSPRKQMFSDLSTPGPYQTAFSHSLYNHTMPPPPERTTSFTPLQTQHEGTQTQSYIQLPLSPSPVNNRQTPPPPMPPTTNGYGSLNAAVHDSPGGKISPNMLLRKMRSEDNASPLQVVDVIGGKRKSSMQRFRNFAS